MARLTILATILCLQFASLITLSLADSLCDDSNTYNRYYPGNCDKYYHCDHGKATEESCGWFHRFDENTNSCAFKFLLFGSANCTRAMNPKPTSPPTGPTSKATSQTPTSQPTSATPTTSPTKSSTTTTTKPDPNSSTTKKNSSSTVELSMLLASICAVVLSARFYRH